MVNGRILHRAASRPEFKARYEHELDDRVYLVWKIQLQPNHILQLRPRDCLSICLLREPNSGLLLESIRKANEIKF